MDNTKEQTQIFHLIDDAIDQGLKYNGIAELLRTQGIEEDTIEDIIIQRIQMRSQISDFQVELLQVEEETKVEEKFNIKETSNVPPIRKKKHSLGDFVPSSVKGIVFLILGGFVLLNTLTSEVSEAPENIAIGLGLITVGILTLLFDYRGGI